MRKTTAMLISNFILVTAVFGQTVQLSIDEPAAINAIDGRPVTLNTNFSIKSAELLLTDETAASLRLLEKGFVVVPSKPGMYRATIVVESKDGSVYTVDYSASPTGATVFKLEDQLVGAKDSDKEELERYESSEIDQDAKNIVKSVLLGEKMSGFEKSKAPKSVNAQQFNMDRTFRHIGGKYIADEWVLTNTTNEAIYFEEEDFYTNGIIAIALEKNRLQPGEKIYIIMLVNKSAIYEANKVK